jgi:putative colanic acid biosynthesis UDP-glucose lipid carrier transferase
MPNSESENSSDILLKQSESKILLHRRILLSSAFQFSLDLLFTLAALYFLVIIRTDDFSEPYRILSTITTLLMFMIYYNRGIYNNHKTFVTISFLVIRSWLLVMIGLIIIAFVTKQSAVYSREVVILWFFIGGSSQLVAHACFRILILYSRKFEIPQNALLIGAGDTSQYLAERINNNPWVSNNVVGVIDDDEQVLNEWNIEHIPKLGKISELNKIIKDNEIKSLYISLPASKNEDLQNILLDILEQNLNIYWAPPVFDVRLVEHNIGQIGNVPLISLSESRLTGRRALSKKVIDYILTFTTLILLSPLMIATAIAIKLTSPGPVFFKQKRHGWHDEVFNVWKFRSMYIHKEKEGQVTQAVKNDPRTTKIGSFIRKTSIDELPQLFNILNGTMSLVGPRPQSVEHNIFYSKKIHDYMLRHKIKPGITGLAQVHNCRGEIRTIKDMERRIKYDLEYINNWSFKLDVKIIFQTFRVLYSDKAY